jgi:hypothetical protein
MKINLLRDDQISKGTSAKQSKDVLSFDDTVSGGNDDFYFEQPIPRQGRYKRERRFSFGWFVFLVICFGLIIIVATNPRETRDFLSRMAHKFAKTPSKINDNRAVQEQVFFSQRPPKAPVKDPEPDYVPQPESKPVAEVNAPKPATNTVVKTEPKPVQEVIRVEKPVYKEVVKEIYEENVVKSPVIFETIRDDVAISKRNLYAAEYAWSKIPGGVTVDEMVIEGNVIRLVLSSRNSELINSYPNVMSQHEMFLMIVPNDPEIVDGITRVYMYSELPDFDPSDRPERIWDLKVKWLDDYFNIAAGDADVKMTSVVKGSELMPNDILLHKLKVNVTGERAPIMVFLHDIQDIPASIVFKGMKSTYDTENKTYVMDLDIYSYERR